MIYLIGGPPKCGKTTLAKTMARALGLPWVSTDTLECIIRPYMNEYDLPKKFPAQYQGGKDNDAKFSSYSTDEILSAYQQQAKTAYQAIDMFAVCEIVYGNDFIIEGYHIEPKLASELTSKYPDKIRSVFLIKKDEKKFITDIQKSTTPDDWILARTNNEETYQKIAVMISAYGNFFAQEAAKYRLPILNMDENFGDRIKEAISLLTIK